MHACKTSEESARFSSATNRLGSSSLVGGCQRHEVHVMLVWLWLWLSREAAAMSEDKAEAGAARQRGHARRKQLRKKVSSAQLLATAWPAHDDCCDTDHRERTKAKEKKKAVRFGSAAVDKKQLKDKRNAPVSSTMSVIRARVLEFCQMTSLHGWNFCFREGQPLAFTLGWILVILFSTMSAGYLMWVNIGDFAQATVSFNLDSPTVPLSEVIFPSIVVCNMNLLRRSFVYSLLSDPSVAETVHGDYSHLQQTIDKMFIKGLDEVPSEEEERIVEAIMNSKVYSDLFDELLKEALDPETLVSGTSNVSSWNSLIEADLSTNETVDAVRRGRIVELAAQFREGETVAQIDFSGFGAYYEQAFATDVSETCFFIAPYFKEPPDTLNLRTILKGVHNGANNGFQMLLDAEAYDYTSTISGSEGFLVSVLHPLDITIMKQTGINIETGQSIQVAVTPSLVDTTAACKRRFPPIRRQCYFEDEVTLTHFPPELDYRYEMSTCLYESTLQKIERECGCTPVKYVDVVANFSACEGLAKKCMVQLSNELGGERMIDDAADGVTKECLAACHDQSHAFFVTQASFPNRQSFYSRPEFCVVLAKLRKACAGDRRRSLSEYMPELCPSLEELSNVTCDRIQTGEVSADGVRFVVAKYARENMALVNVYIRDPYVKKFLTEEKITEISFVGTVGGLLGLFVGFSFVSAAEVLFVSLFGDVRVGSTRGASRRSARNKRALADEAVASSIFSVTEANRRTNIYNVLHE